MKAVLQIAGAITAVIVLVVVGLAAGWMLWGRQVWSPGPVCLADVGPGVGRWGSPGMACPVPSQGPGRGLTERTDSRGTPLSMDQARQSVEATIASSGDAGLELAEMMEFELNFYAIVRERDTGIGAMELLVDKWTGEVSPEYGPNMMWNARYGMHRAGRGMMGRSNEENSLSPEVALSIAQDWLDARRPGETVEEHADPFYGYYTIHTLRDGEISGMLSVHGTTGDVWYHTWHGAFIQMVEEDHD